MKAYTTPEIAVMVPGQEQLLHDADRVVLTIKPQQGEAVNIEGERLTVTEGGVSVRLTEQETAELSGTSEVEVTIFAASLVYKTKTVMLTIHPALWDNGGIR